ncbi:hypothetical protein K456DRAFT_1834908 [Colletotrichum gloeosporioides 23]|nr:hypothetical protein K456DRAFT_1834908 [Colletotrichum gloeosporioides 23]
MIASLAVERRGVRLHAVAQVSMARFASVGPIGLALLALQDSFAEPLMRILLGCLVLTTVSTQFTSTLLLTDLSQGSVVSPLQHIQSTYRVLVAEEDLRPRNGKSRVSDVICNYWQQKPRLSEIFAEFAKGSALEADGFDDTGVTARSFIPLESQEEREKLLDFRGVTRVIDSRVTCARPNVTGVSICAGSLASVGEPGAAKTAYLVPQNFYHSKTRILWEAGQFIDPLIEPENTPLEWLLNVTLHPVKVEYTGPWVQQAFRWSVPSGKNGSDLSLKMTACINEPFSFSSTPLSYDHMHIVASRPKVKKEPAYNLAAGKWMYDTGAVRRQLGAATSQTETGDRGIMFITAGDMEKSIADAFNNTRTIKEEGMTEDMWFLSSFDVDGAVNFCSGTVCHASQSVDMVYADLFNTIISETNSPARALQAVNFVMARMAYYDMLPSFTLEKSEETTIRTMKMTIVPTRYGGYLAVMGILAAFFILFIIISVLFSTTKFSLLDNAWHTIAQMSESAEISGMLSRAKAMTDAEVKASGKEQQDDDEDRFLIRNGAFVRASFLADSAAEDPGKLSNARQLRRRLMERGLDQ